jgi:hypothetical protein
VKPLPVSRKHFLEKNCGDLVKTMSRKRFMCTVEGRRYRAVPSGDDSPRFGGVPGTCVIEARRPILCPTP